MSLKYLEIKLLYLSSDLNNPTLTQKKIFVYNDKYSFKKKLAKLQTQNTL